MAGQLKFLVLQVCPVARQRRKLSKLPRSRATKQLRGAQAALRCHRRPVEATASLHDTETQKPVLTTHWSESKSDSADHHRVTTAVPDCPSREYNVAATGDIEMLRLAEVSVLQESLGKLSHLLTPERAQLPMMPLFP
uniref:Uncharacterized protein n=1 Tax=Coccidioides posadasii RMSCC 3488 TaxID=454284 RepID=A0A0J6I1V8_COCPO|nr:hypothetical protein CPAG_01618 [Coccidioides posadasii RMSCC 3488]